MNTYFKYALMGALLSIKTLQLTAYNPFKEMQESFKRMEEMFEKNMQHIDSLRNSIDIALEEKKDHALITVKNLETSNIDAWQEKEADQETGNILIKTDQGTIALQAQDNYISIQWQHKKQKDSDTFYGQQTLNATLSRSLALQTDKITLNYHEESKTLSLLIPFVQEINNTPKKESIPVNITKKKA